jgi:acetylglutamate kinase
MKRRNERDLELSTKQTLAMKNLKRKARKNLYSKKMKRIIKILVENVIRMIKRNHFISEKLKRSLKNELHKEKMIKSMID